MSTQDIQARQNQLLEELALFEDWSDRYEYIIALGRKLPPMPEELKTPQHLIKGCQSQVWFHASLQDGKVVYAADSDSVITKGMIAIFVYVLSNQNPADILQADFGFLEQTGLKQHLAPTRANALSGMGQQMKQAALALLHP